MCGIISIFDLKEDDATLRKKALEMARTIRHRGPDAGKLVVRNNCILGHERLSIMDPEKGIQPMTDDSSKTFLIVNGEIYDHKEHRERLQKHYSFKTDSDSEVLLYLYKEQGVDFLDKINGMFSFVIYDEEKDEIFVARDHVGIIPLYIGWDAEGQTYVASELKAIDSICSKVQEFPPGHYYLSSEKKFVKWFNPSWEKTIPEKSLSLSELRDQLESAVKRQMMSDVPFGVLLSGGLDSSIIAAVAQKYSDRPLHSFTIGLKDSPDLEKARLMAKHLGTIHHEFVYTVEEGFDAIPDVIRHIETFDVTTVRASTPMYLMARKIKSLGIKMVLSGEGADEVFGGYLYFHMAPSKEELHKETVRKLFALSKYDCLRANKSLAAWGVEARVPFLDRSFLDFAMGFDPKEKMCSADRMEKWVVRKAFEDLLPKEIVWRQKEQFSDGVGYGWIDYLKDYADSSVSDDLFSMAKKIFPLQTPLNKEEYVYRSIFDGFFVGKSSVLTVPSGKTIACSTPVAFEWSKSFKESEPSGRAVKTVHEAASVKD